MIQGCNQYIKPETQQSEKKQQDQDQNKNVRARPMHRYRLDVAKSSELNARLCAAYIKKSRYAVAMEKCKKSLKYDSKNAKPHKWLAVLYQRLGQTGKAAKHFKRAVALDSGDAGTRNNYGTFLCKQMKYVAAEKQFLLAAGDPLYPARAYALANAGVCMMEAGQHKKAEQYFRSALRIDIFNSLALINLAQLRFDQGSYKSAMPLLKKWSMRNKQNARSLWLNIQIAKLNRNKDRVSSLGMLLNARFPESNEAQHYRKMN